METTTTLDPEDPKITSWVAALPGRVDRILTEKNQMHNPLSKQEPVALQWALQDESRVYEGPPIFCSSDGVEACLYLHRKLQERKIPIPCHFFNLTAVHTKHIM